MAKSSPQRTCLGCGGRGNKRSLVRICLAGEEPVVDERQVMPGRGGYICKSRRCVERLKKNGRLANALRIRKSGAVGDFLRRAEEKIMSQGVMDE